MNKSRSKSFIHSIRFKLIAGLIVVMLPVVTYLIYNNVYSINVVRNQVAASISDTVSLYMDIVDQSLDSVDAYLLRLIIEENGFLPLEAVVTHDPDAYQLEKIRVFQKMYEDMRYYQMLDFTFIYNTLNDEIIFVPNEYKQRDNIPDWQKISGSLAELARSASGMGHEKAWFDQKIGDEYYALRLIKSGELYIGMGININFLLGPRHIQDLGENIQAVFTNDQNEPLRDERFFLSNDLNLAYSSNHYEMTGEHKDFLIVGEASSKGLFHLVALVPDEVILEQLPYLLRITYVIAGASVLGVVAAIVALRKAVLLPIRRILSAMRKVKDGFLDERIPYSRSSNEFETMNDTFNSMLTEIQQLKINIYEEQLVSQKAELRQLQLQINPHFFLNSLNIVYYLAQDKKYPLIQELSLSLIRYFRFMFQSGADFVSLQDEIKHTENYLRIQSFRFPDHLSYEVEVSEGALSISLPPLIIQTFVENSIKYAMDTDRQTHIHINVELLSPEELRIMIQDTGPGFPDELLQMLQRNVNLMSAQGEHVGIWNVKRRLELLYNGRATIHFANQDGALVEIRIPVK